MITTAFKRPMASNINQRSLVQTLALQGAQWISGGSYGGKLRREVPLPSVETSRGALQYAL